MHKPCISVTGHFFNTSIEQTYPPLSSLHDVEARPTCTCNNYVHVWWWSSCTLPPQPPAGSFPAHINSCNFHTESSVHLGWSHDWLHPSGTMAASYQPLSQVIQRAKAPSTDNLPLHYYSGHVTNSTAADSYRGLGHGHKINKTNANTMNSVSWASRW